MGFTLNGSSGPHHNFQLRQPDLSTLPAPDLIRPGSPPKGSRPENSTVPTSFDDVTDLRNLSPASISVDSELTSTASGSDSDSSTHSVIVYGTTSESITTSSSDDLPDLGIPLQIFDLDWRLAQDYQSRSQKPIDQLANEGSSTSDSTASESDLKDYSAFINATSNPNFSDRITPLFDPYTSSKAEQTTALSVLGESLADEFVRQYTKKNPTSTIALELTTLGNPNQLTLKDQVLRIAKESPLFSGDLGEGGYETLQRYIEST